MKTMIYYVKKTENNGLYPVEQLVDFNSQELDNYIAELKNNGCFNISTCSYWNVTSHIK